MISLDVKIRTGDPLSVEDILAVMADTERLYRVAFEHGASVSGAFTLLVTGSLGEHPLPDL